MTSDGAPTAGSIAANQSPDEATGPVALTGPEVRSRRSKRPIDRTGLHGAADADRLVNAAPNPPGRAEARARLGGVASHIGCTHVFRTHRGYSNTSAERAPDTRRSHPVPRAGSDPCRFRRWRETGAYAQPCVPRPSSGPACGDARVSDRGRDVCFRVRRRPGAACIRRRGTDPGALPRRRPRHTGRDQLAATLGSAARSFSGGGG